MNKLDIITLSLVCAGIIVVILRSLITKYCRVDHNNNTCYRIYSCCQFGTCCNERHQDDLVIDLTTSSREAEEMHHWSRNMAEDSSEIPYEILCYGVMNERDADPESDVKGQV
ncbi:hypothetical protein JTE90_013459 [Oedothorax gibbosus]|uniref:Uncharacterized protein n=1 Tax=Oedothorax gibbosus TaxID=931172 RepID=A0AAV6VL02_9ARAC|nr:hypothetical protein JTE90_013459 [Oedothorax gibbosus]